MKTPIQVAVLVTMNFRSIYSNIKHNERRLAMKEDFNKRITKTSHRTNNNTNATQFNIKYLQQLTYHQNYRVCRIPIMHNHVHG